MSWLIISHRLSMVISCLWKFTDFIRVFHDLPGTFLARTVFFYVQVEINLPINIKFRCQVSVTFSQTPTARGHCIETRVSFSKLLLANVRVVQARPPTDQPCRLRDTAADFTFFTTLLLIMSRRRVDPAVVGAVLVCPSPFYCSVL